MDFLPSKLSTDSKRLLKIDKNLVKFFKAHFSTNGAFQMPVKLITEGSFIEKTSLCIFNGGLLCY